MRRCGARTTAKPRRCYELNEIAWGAVPDADPDDNPTIEATELRKDVEGAHDLLMATLGHDLRCLDAHAHLGNLVFDDSPERALMHYEIGMRIASYRLERTSMACSHGAASTTDLTYLRCVHGYGLSLWRLGRTDAAARVFERILALNPNDNQGARFCLFDLRDGLTWGRLKRATMPKTRESQKRHERSEQPGPDLNKEVTIRASIEPALRDVRSVRQGAHVKSLSPSARGPRSLSSRCTLFDAGDCIWK